MCFYPKHVFPAVFITLFVVFLGRAYSSAYGFCVGKFPVCMQKLLTQAARGQVGVGVTLPCMCLAFFHISIQSHWGWVRIMKNIWRPAWISKDYLGPCFSASPHRKNKWAGIFLPDTWATWTIQFFHSSLSARGPFSWKKKEILKNTVSVGPLHALIKCSQPLSTPFLWIRALVFLSILFRFASTNSFCESVLSL